MVKSKGVLVWLFYCVLVLTWGSSFILMKQGLKYYSPPQVATIRLISAMIVLGGFATIHIRKIPFRSLGYVLLSALLVMFIPAYLFCYAESQISSAVAGILNALTPFFTFILGVLYFKQPVHRMQIAGLLIGFTGILFLTLINSNGELSFNRFTIFVIIASFCYGLNINIVKTYLSHVNPLHLSTVSVTFAGLFSLIYLWGSGGIPIMPLSLENRGPVIASVILGVCGTAVAQVLFNYIIRRSTPVFSSSIIFALPVVAIFWGVLDGESLLIWHYVGMVCIISGILVMRRSA
jgi:drug/metabolite transporter (DMT)-like permease